VVICEQKGVCHINPYNCCGKPEVCFFCEPPSFWLKQVLLSLVVGINGIRSLEET
jgi:hypothetical protein